MVERVPVAKCSRGKRNSWPGLVLLGALGVLVAFIAASVAPGHALAATPHVTDIQFASNVDPSSAQFVGGAIDNAQTDGSVAIVIELDTFGGDLASMQTIREKELGSAVPIIVYVSPSGAHADSAGALLAMAAPIIAMAPGTRIGAASPVDVTGADLPATEKAKVTNALVAQVDSDQTAFHRNATLGEQMVTQASAFDDTDAVADNVVNLQATSLDNLLTQLDGQTVQLANGSNGTLQLAGVPIVTVQPGIRDQLYALLLDSNVLFIIFVIAAVCIYLEISHPGAILPGTLGGIALILFLLGAGSLSPNWAGLALMLLSIVLLAIDVRVPTHGILTAGALVSLVVGTLLFFNSGPSDQAISPYLVIGVAIGVGGVALIVLRFAIATQRLRVDTGGQRLLGQLAVVITPLAPDGRVRILGEDWSATLTDPSASAAVGDKVRIVRVEGLRLRVEPAPVQPQGEGV
jgi:membrane-bound serine protease (ClpP class)